MKFPLFQVVGLAVVLLLLGCGEDHVITNNAVELRELKYNGSHDYCIVTYSLDVGARGSRLYRTLLKTENLDGNLLEGHLPTGVANISWLDNRTASVEYNSWLESHNATGNRKLIPMFERQDTVQVGEIKFIVTSRKDSR
ncbi:MAG: hypothetical protein EOO89_23835 [Pedobacter sp.]|nr:MAG: hypothetical protein EOO89_23835 [Pedobacter sp.]